MTGCCDSRAPSWPPPDKHADETGIHLPSSKGCCNHDCDEGRTCPVRLRNAQILAGLQREVTDLLAAEPPACSAPATGNGSTLVVFGTSTPAAPEAPYQWLDDLFFKVLSRALLALSVVVAAGCAGYVYQHFWGR